MTSAAKDAAIMGSRQPMASLTKATSSPSAQPRIHLAAAARSAGVAPSQVAQEDRASPGSLNSLSQGSASSTSMVSKRRGAASRAAMSTSIGGAAPASSVLCTFC